MNVVWWLVGAVVLTIIEILSVDLVFAMFAVGALAAGSASMLGAGTGIQVLVFASVSVLLLILVRPVIKKHLAASTPGVETNAQGLVGKAAQVEREVTREDGRVRLAGEVWSARSVDDTVLPVDAQVVVIRIDGATAIVAAQPVSTN
ncbi:NfeD family protein [Schaalia vaccimaxillae]|uniref:NfeD family protein n=1 Tax=Schaalia vaccimaxillae TaxID=183916 RepID=UPI0003B3EE58|nr:NfeD family protein [Schaalia vaccimaxillae]